MYFLDFCQSIKTAFDTQNKIENDSLNSYFLSELNSLISSDKTEQSLKMTRATILLEGFYRHLSNNHLKILLHIVRRQRWKQHFGTPTVPFLLSYKNQINQTKQLFDELADQRRPELKSPWLIKQKVGFIIDQDNDVIVDPIAISRVVAPEGREVIGIFTKTHNPCGGFTTAPCDPVSQKFIEHAAIAARRGGKLLEIGAGFGAATLEAIAKGATVFCNDIDPENLAVVRKRFLESEQDQTKSTTGDNSNLILIPGELPHELTGLPENFFDAILISRVLHFFSGTQIDESLSLMSKLLTSGGKIYIVCETPFLKNWQRFIPEFQSRVERNIEWPGEITNPADYENSGRAASLPKFVHWITKEVIERSLVRAGLKVAHSAYINRLGQFPDDLLLPEHGKESIGAIGVKP